MAWPIPAPGVIASRAASVYEQALPGIDARNPNTVATTNCRIIDMSMQDLYFYQGSIEQEMFPDTCSIVNLPRFAVQWNVPRTLASAADGNVIVPVQTGGQPLTLPADIPFSSNTGVTYTSTASVTVAAGATTAVVPIEASVAGSAGNLAAGAPMTITTPVAGITSQTATVDPNGITGGADLQSIASWRAAIIAEIRYEPAAGTNTDYVKWVSEALPNVALAACPQAGNGPGAVTVAFLMEGFVPPTSEQIATVLAYIQTKRPVGITTINVIAGTLNPVNVTLHLNPDTPAIRAAAIDALTLSFQQDAALGGTTYYSRLDNAVSSSDGEYSHERIAPAADVPAPNLYALNTLGTVTFA